MSAETAIDYLVTGMTCGHCERAVTDEVSRVPGVTGVDVSAASGRLTIATDGAVPADADVIAAVDEAGYSAVRA